MGMGGFGGYGFGSMLGYGLIGGLLNLAVIAVVVYYAVKLALKHSYQDQTKNNKQE